MRVAVKVQYPGVAESIESDIANLSRLASVTGIFPKGMFLEHGMGVMKDELAAECDYTREAEMQRRYRDLLMRPSEILGDEFYHKDWFKVPRVIGACLFSVFKKSF